MEGRLLYNDNTIVLIFEKATVNGKEEKNYAIRAKTDDPYFIWYYTLTDGVLHLESNRKFQSGIRMWENDGELRKID